MSCEHAQAAGGQAAPQQFCENDLSHVKRVVAVLSGKGGVGKSLVSGLLATELSRRGGKVGILDADVTGPSIPKMLGLSGRHATGVGSLLLPEPTQGGIKVMSSNLLLEHETDPVLWRGPVIAGAIRQFWSETAWGDLDYLLVDMPPGTGDVALTVFQSLPVTGIVVVTSPQDLVSMIVAKAVNMAGKMDVPVLGAVENMSYATCPCCGERIPLFGEGKLDAVAAEYGIPVLGRLGLDPALAAACDAGTFEQDAPSGLLDAAVEAIASLPARNPSEKDA